MRKLPLLALAGALALPATAATAVSASAAPLHLVPSLNSMSGTAHVEEVQFRRWHGHRHHHHGWRGRDAWLALGIGSAIAGGMIASQPYGYGYYDGPYAYGGPVYGGPAYADSSGWDRCRAEFRSLRADGTYTTYGGEQKLCPYLR